MSHLYLDLLYEVYNTMHQHYQKQGRFFSSLLLNFLDILDPKRDLKSSLMMLFDKFSLSICIESLLESSTIETKLIYIVN